MERLALTDAEARAGLGVVKGVALADGALAPEEIALLDAAGRALGISDGAGVPAFSPEAAAAALASPVARERAVQAAIFVSMIDGRAADEEVREVERYAAALGVTDPRIHNLRQLARGQVKRMWIDLARRSFARPVFERALRERGLGGLWEIAAPMVGLGKDPELARRFIALGELPEGTLGHAYFRFIVDNDLGFPGEGPVAADGVWHDLTHVLAGYGTDPRGEISVVSFVAGYRREDPFFWLFTITLQFHLGIKVSPYSPGEIGRVDPEDVLRALRRGMAVTRDLSDGWDYFPELARPLEDVRRDLGVPPP